MAWNPSPKVATARDIGNKFNADKVIIILINESEARIEAVSYGKTKTECAVAEHLANVAYDAVFDYIST